MRTAVIKPIVIARTPRIRSYTRALWFSPNRRHLFVTPCSIVLFQRRYCKTQLADDQRTASFYAQISQQTKSGGRVAPENQREVQIMSYLFTSQPVGPWIDSLIVSLTSDYSRRLSDDFVKFQRRLAQALKYSTVFTFEQKPQACRWITMH